MDGFRLLLEIGSSNKSLGDSKGRSRYRFRLLLEIGSSNNAGCILIPLVNVFPSPVGDWFF